MNCFGALYEGDFAFRKNEIFGSVAKKISRPVAVQGNTGFFDYIRLAPHSAQDDMA